MAAPAQPAQLSDVLGALRRHWRVAAAAALVGMILGLIAGFVVPARYSATASVDVNPMNNHPLNTAADSSHAINMATEEELIRSHTVGRPAADLLRKHRLTTREVEEATSVETPQDSQVVRISFVGSSPRQAADGANAVAKAYLQARHDRATKQIDQLEERVQKQVDTLQSLSAKATKSGSKSGSPVPELVERSWRIQVDALGTKLAELTTLDLDPGRIVDVAAVPRHRSTPGFVTLGIAGLFLGLVVGIPLALTRKEEDSRIENVDGLTLTEDQLVLDGTQDTDRAETWDIAAFMLKIPQNMEANGTFLIMVDSEPVAGRPAPGQELVEALSRRGRTARFVDAGAINEGKISRGWPTDKKRKSWAGEVVIIDTTNVGSDARKVALATRSNSVLIARSTTDDAGALRRLVGLFNSKGVDIALTALFPPRPEYIVLGQ